MARVDRNEINYEYDLFEKAAEAINEKDTEKLESLMGIAENWLEPDYEKDARRDFLDAVLNLMYKSEDIYQYDD